MPTPLRGDIQYRINILNKLYVLLKGRKEGRKGGKQSRAGT